MDDLYPSMTIQENSMFSSPAEIYIYGSVLVGILGAFITLTCLREPRRYYRIMKRKNTDESPIIQI